MLLATRCLIGSGQVMRQCSFTYDGNAVSKQLWNFNDDGPVKLLANMIALRNDMVKLIFSAIWLTSHSQRYDSTHFDGDLVKLILSKTWVVLAEA